MLELETSNDSVTQKCNCDMKKKIVEINEICEENIYTCFILQEVQIVVYVFIFNDI